MNSSIKKLFVAISFLFSIQLHAQSRFNVDSIGNYKHPNLSGVNTNEVWGYVDSNGTEYALVGWQRGFSVISLADPSNPLRVYSDTSASSLWRDLKTWAGYAYVVNEQSGGLEIYDLRSLPDSVTKVGNFTGDTFSLQTAHNLWIDSSGVAYIFGTNNRLATSAGTIFLDLATDPERPIELGNYADYYIHDGYVRNDTLYAGAVNDGIMIIVDVRNKLNPVLLGSVTTPSAFTHNVWLSDDGNTAFTTDEVSGGYIGAYDVSNPAQPFERDRIRTRNTSVVIPHNVHVLNDFLITSYYTAGVSIIDATNPDKLVEVGYFDTSPNYFGNGFNGNWGAYPFLPSGLLLASDMEEGLFVLRPSYDRASILEVFLLDCNGNRISNIQIALDSTYFEKTNVIGLAQFGTPLDGYFPLHVEVNGYYPIKLDSVELRPGVTKRLSLELQDSLSTLNVRTVDGNSSRLSNVKINISDDTISRSISTDVFGNASFSGLKFGEYTIEVSAWGYKNICPDTILNYSCDSDSISFLLEEGIEDNFEKDLGWQVSGNETAGAWTIAEPIGTVDRIYVANPGVDAFTDCGSKAYVTGNGVGAADAYDVDSTTILRSPLLQLDGYIEPYLVFYTWFYNGADQADDAMIISLIDINDQEVPVDTLRQNSPNTTWLLNNIKISNYLDPDSVKYIQFEISDQGNPSILEGGIDHFFVSEGEYIGLSENMPIENMLNIFPNPFENNIQISSDVAIRSYELYDASARLLKSALVNAKQFELRMEKNVEKGLYFLRLQTEEGEVFSKKLIKQ